MVDWSNLRGLLRDRPLLCLWWLLLWLVEAAAVGLLAAVLVFGWLNQGLGWPTFLTGGLIALLVGWFRLQQRSLQLQRHTSAAKRLGRRLVVSPLVVVFALVLVSVWQLWAGGLLPLTTGRENDLHRLFTALERNYPYFSMKQIDWSAMQSEYLPKLQAAESDDRFLEVLGEFLAGLHDLHTGVTAPYRLAGWRGFLAVRPIAGQAVVTAVRAGLELPGLAPGAVILRRNEQSIQAFVDSLPLSLRSSSTPWSAEAGAYSLLGSARESDELFLTYLGTDGVTHSEQLVWQPAFDQPHTTRRAAVSAERLDSGLGLIRVNSLSGGFSLVDQFNQALDSLIAAPGIILDLRSNGGGSSLLGDAMAGRFLEQGFIYGQEHYRQRLPQRAWAKSASYQVRPRGKTYTGDLVVLVGTNTASSAEMLAVALKDSGRATLVGQTTAGGSGNPLQFAIAGGMVRFSTGDFQRNDGTPIEGAGIAPDILVNWTVEDVAAGRDPDLLAAAAILHQMSGK